MPEGAEVHIIGSPVLEEVAVNRIVRLGGAGLDTGRSMVGP